MSLDRREFLAALTPMLLRPRLADDPKDAELPADGDKVIAAILRDFCRASKLPGMTAAIVRPGEPLRLAAVGHRKVGSPEAFTSGDLVHLGSDTKAMTATMIATLVEDGKLSWTSTLARTFPDAKIDEGYRDVTLLQLLTHRASLPANVNWWNLGAGKSTTDQRRVLMKDVLSKPPLRKPGSAKLYSNVGYALAGLMAETVADRSWEDLMAERLFRPLGMKSAGFGPPGAGGKVDQPWGHRRIIGKLLASQSDNAAAMGPAGTVHCTMSDWAKFAELHLRGGRGEKTPILKPETFRTLQTPNEGEDYAKGWIVKTRDWAGGKALAHSGSNTMWQALIWLAPLKNVAFLAVCNDGESAAGTACDSAIGRMIESKD